MIAMSEVRGEVRICPVGRYQLDSPAVSGDAVKLTHNSHRVVHVFDDVSADHFVEFVIRERIRQIVKVMDNISRSSRVNVHADRARNLVRAATNVKHPRLDRPRGEVVRCLGLRMQCIQVPSITSGGS
jgi:hypothetical protein